MWDRFCRVLRLAAGASSVIAAALIVVLVVLQPLLASAQDVSPDILRALQQHQSTGGDDDPTAGSGKPVIQTYQPVGVQPDAPPSRLEELYSARAGRQLRQIGYNQFGTPATISIAPAGAVQDSYVLGVGDELVFNLRGQENASFRQRVDRNGRVVLPKLNPVTAAGRTLADFRSAMEAEVNNAYVSTKIFVSLGEVHQVTVLVTGYVRSPGTRVLNALGSPVDAILLSGGIAKSGTLRSVQLIRNGTIRTIDLYALLVQGRATRLGSLQDGDRIYVPQLGATVAIAGSVRRPGIYELPAGVSATNAANLVTLAGGPVIANAYDLSKTMLDRDGTTRLLPVPQGAIIRSGEILFVDPSRTADLDRVTLSGAVQTSGTRPLSTAGTTATLFHSVTDLLPTAYTPLGVIVRRNPQSNARLLVPFSVIRAINHQAGLPLQSDDSIYIFSSTDLRALTRIATRNFNEPYTPQAEIPAPKVANGANGTGAAGGDVPRVTPPITSFAGTNGANSASIDPRVRSAQSGVTSEAAALAEGQALARSELGGSPGPTDIPSETDDQIVNRVSVSLGVPRDMLLHFISDHLVWVLDQVHVPGALAAAEGTTLPEIIEAAGGTLSQADLSTIEVTSTKFDRDTGTSRTTRSEYAANDDSFRLASIQPLDVVRLRAIYTDRTGETIIVSGQVRYPGVFDITRDERLSSVLQRAGGITEVGYPYGAIFTRRSAAIHEQEGNDRTARELQSQLAVLAATPTQTTQAETNVSFLASLVQSIRDTPALGRVTVTADPVVLASRPELDLILEPGDQLYIPKRPSSVTVVGQVLNPGSFQFRTDLGFQDYLERAGGVTQTADDGDTFIVLPDGSAIPTKDNWLSFGNTGHIPPGSTIVVPRDLRPFDWGQFLKDATQIVSQLAVSAASLAVLRNN